MKRWILLAIFILLLLEPVPVAAANEETLSSDFTESLVEDLELEEIEEMLDGLLGGEDFHLMEALEQLLRGEQPFTREEVLSLVYNGIFRQLDNQKEMILQILLLVIGAALFTNFAKAFDKGYIAEVCFYVVYLVLFALLVSNFGRLTSQLQENLNTIVTLMQAIAPAYALAITAASGVSSAAVFYQLVLILLLIIQWVILNFLLPCTSLYLLLELVNHLSREDLLSRLAELLKSLVEWSLKTLLGLVVGLQVIQNMVAPVIDSLKRTALGKTASVIPGVGNAMNAVTEIILTSAVLVRNCLGVVFLLVFILWGITPLLGYGITTLVYKILAAVIQPVSDKRMVSCLATMGEGCRLLLNIFFTTEILCMITIVILAATFR